MLRTLQKTKKAIRSIYIPKFQQFQSNIGSDIVPLFFQRQNKGNFKLIEENKNHLKTILDSQLNSEIQEIYNKSNLSSREIGIWLHHYISSYIKWLVISQSYFSLEKEQQQQFENYFMRQNRVQINQYYSEREKTVDPDFIDEVAIFTSQYKEHIPQNLVYIPQGITNEIPRVVHYLHKLQKIASEELKRQKIDKFVLLGYFGENIKEFNILVEFPLIMVGAGIFDVLVVQEKEKRVRVIDWKFSKQDQGTKYLEYVTKLKQYYGKDYLIEYRSISLLPSILGKVIQRVNSQQLEQPRGMHSMVSVANL